ncbi:nitrate- and nitrite sensing domain-containing protein [Actinocorallia sp. API 0066]|uniref:sensor histidine kinase n=1 Tax=Actinocorallia sp. API 0066 TaxID=2896846 RepID=UPI001E582AB3|nr:ATP-binding protein [Actinocorallia sp. API 0066]MCD0449125.1 nitrate- and nitrite sensing domain-containing protein [Actinocorallia sp. API 0066]
MRGRRSATRSPRRSGAAPVGGRLALVLVLPLVSLVALWAFAAGASLNEALRMLDLRAQTEYLHKPIEGVIIAIQEERTAAAMGTSDFADKVSRTDTLIAGFRAEAFSPDSRDVMDPITETRLRAVDDALTGISTLRAQVKDANPLDVVNGYSEVFDTIMYLMGVVVSIDDLDIQRNGASVLDLFRSSDLLMRQTALLGGLPHDGKLDPAQRAAFAGWASAREQFFRLGVSGLDAEYAAKFEAAARTPEYARLTDLERRIGVAGVNTKNGPSVAEWQQAVGAAMPALFGPTPDVVTALRADVEPIGRQIMTRLVVAGGLGLLAVIGSLLLSIRLARSITGDLKGLEKAAHTLADERLPDVVARLRRGEDVDRSLAEAPLPGDARTSEIVSVARAFGTVQHTAVEVAIGEAHLRQSIGKVFVNLSWRSQGLLQRQLQLLDQMERRAASPEELDDLFKVDHLTTRMRRHAEGLVILSGEPTVRAFDHPVPIEDIIRAAIGEVEDYTRVEPIVSRSSSITGAIVADVIHLLAELIENATVFSPPGTEVLVKAETVANGLAVEIVDRGLGLYPDQIAELNGRLADPPEFDLADSSRLGLFVVARLADRHGIRVALQPSAYGGTTAVVLIPSALTVHEAERRPAVERSAPRPELEPPATSSGAHARPPSPVLEPPRGADNRFESGSTPGRLPRRRRQQNMAPQLRTSAPPAASLPDDDFEEPDPESSRALMASLQQGWTMAREGKNPADPENERNRP